MKRRDPKTGLSEEDRRLWNEIRRSVKPLHRRQTRVSPPAIEDMANAAKFGTAQGGEPESNPSGPPRLATVPAYYPPVSHKYGPSAGSVRLDDVTMRKLKRGKIAVDARIDLHGMTQSRAHAALAAFLQDCADAGKRLILVITGKGRTGEGVLRRQVPLWLSEPGLRDLVGGYRSAHVSHGGEGALYVRLRRRDRRRKGPR